MYVKFWKRFFDITIASVAMIVLSPVFLVAAVCIKLDSKGPVLFFQKRVGINKKHFMIIKFRTMSSDTPADIPTHQLSGAGNCITRVGAVLRKTSIDELPQLWNIIVGDMSLIGPRPALYNQYDLIRERDKYRANAVRPGLTGWAQVNGRDELPIPVKAKYDGEYTAKISLVIDMRCFLKTIVNVFSGTGISDGSGRV